VPFNDILTANAAFSKGYHELANGRARRGLAIVTCIDTRIDPLEAFGLIPGDAKMVRNAGARVTDDVLRTLVLAAHVLGVNRVALIQHTDCGGTKVNQQQMEKIVGDLTGEDASSMNFLTVTDQIATLHEDAKKIRECPLMPPGTEVGEFMFDVHSGKLSPVQ
jgi:carbonic anhydrase